MPCDGSELCPQPPLPPAGLRKPFRHWQPGENSLFPSSGPPWVGVEPRGGMAELPLAEMGCPGFPAQPRLLPPCRINLAAGREGTAPLPAKAPAWGLFCFAESPEGKFGHSSASIPRHCHWEHEVLHPSCTERILVRYLMVKQRDFGLCGAAGSHPAQQQQPGGSLRDSPVWERLWAGGTG